MLFSKYFSMCLFSALINLHIIIADGDRDGYCSLKLPSTDFLKTVRAVAFVGGSHVSINCAWDAFEFSNHGSSGSGMHVFSAVL